MPARQAGSRGFKSRRHRHWSLSSAGERLVDSQGAAGSNPAVTTSTQSLVLDRAGSQSAVHSCGKTPWRIRDSGGAEILRRASRGGWDMRPFSSTDRVSGYEPAG